MSKNIKIKTRILITVLIALMLILILPKNVKAACSYTGELLTFKYGDSEVIVHNYKNSSGVPTWIGLAHDLWEDGDVDKSEYGLGFQCKEYGLPVHSWKIGSTTYISDCSANFTNIKNNINSSLSTSWKSVDGSIDNFVTGSMDTPNVPYKVPNANCNHSGTSSANTATGKVIYTLNITNQDITANFYVNDKATTKTISRSQAKAEGKESAYNEVYKLAKVMYQAKQNGYMKRVDLIKNGRGIYGSANWCVIDGTISFEEVRMYMLNINLNSYLRTLFNASPGMGLNGGAGCGFSTWKNSTEFIAINSIDKNIEANISFIYHKNWAQPRIIWGVKEDGDNKTVSLKIKKQDFDGNGLSGATINVWDNESDNGGDLISGTKTLTSGTNGAFSEEIQLNIPSAVNDGKVYVYFKETSSPSGYKNDLNANIKVGINYNKSTGAITSLEVEDAYKNHVGFDKDTASIIIKNKPESKLTIEKKFYDSNDALLNNATYYNNVVFEITVKGDGAVGSKFTGSGTGKTIQNKGEKIEITPNSEGKVKIENITDNLEITLTEKSTKDGFLKLNSSYTFTYKFNNGTWTLSGNSSSDVHVDELNKKITIDNRETPNKKIIIQKIDKDKKILRNIEFDLNVKIARICMIKDNIYFDGNLNDYKNESGQLIFPDGARNIQKRDGFDCVSYHNTWKRVIGDGNKDGKIDISGVKTDDNGQIVINVLDYYRIGDVNLDGINNAVDARIVLRMANGLAVESDYQENECTMLLADIDQDGYICGTKEDFKECRNVKTREVENYNGNRFFDSQFTLRESAGLEDIAYSIIGVVATECESDLYTAVVQEETYYYIDDMVIKKDENNDITSYITAFVEAASEYNEEDSNTVNAYNNAKSELIEIVEKQKNPTMIVINEPTPYPLTLKKVDKNGNILKDEYKFTITIDNAKTIKIKQKYIDTSKHSVSGTDQDKIYVVSGNTVYCKTSNGEIKIEEIYAGSIDSKITVKETSVGNNIFDSIGTSEIVKNVTNTGTVQLTSEDSNITIQSGEIKIKEPLSELVLDLVKTDSGDESKKLKGAIFDITVSSGSFKKEYKNQETGADGKIVINDIDINSVALGNEITVTLKETKAPDGYLLPENATSIFKFKYNYNEGRPKYDIHGQNNCTATVSGKTLNVGIVNGRNLPDIILTKTNSLEEGELEKLVEGAKFKIEIDGIKELKIAGKEEKISNNSFEATTNGLGQISLTEIEPLSKTNTSTIKVTVTEISAPDGLKLIEQPIVIEYKYNASNGTVTEFKGTNNDEVEVEYNSDTNLIQINAVDFNVIESLELIKTDSVTGAKMPNTEFTLDFEGKVTELKVHKDCVPSDYSVGTPDAEGYCKVVGSIINCKTDSEGKIKLKDIVITQKDITCTVTETNVPETDGTYYYEKMDKAVKFDISYKTFGKTGNNALTVEDPYLASGSEIKVGSVTKQVSDLAGTTSTNYSVTFNLKNVPLIDLTGQVWLDGQQGDKNVQLPNGLKDDNKYLKGVNVYLHRNGQTDVLSSAVTNNDGKYSFIGLERPNPDESNNGYMLKFEYNGIEYEDTTYYTDVQNGKGDSKAKEITGSDKYSRDTLNSRFETITAGQSNDKTPLEYTYKEADGKGTSDLRGEINGNNPASTTKNFKVHAVTEEYKATSTNVDFGMLDKFFDLSLGMNVETATLKINGQEAIYQYGEETGNAISTLYLNKSDYTFRVEDYELDPYASESNIDLLVDYLNEGNKEDIDAFVSSSSELEIEVKYKLSIKNASTIKSKVNEIAYYYDKNYELKSVKAGNKNLTCTPTNSSITDKNCIIISDIFNQDEYLGTSKDIELVFTVIKDNEGNLPEEILKENGGLKCQNIAEIISYSTKDGGYVDENSAPGNGDKYKEDDLATGGQFNIITRDDERVIAGTVWEDLDKNGIKNGKEPIIKDVVVQLIEIKYINNQYREYIWQETRSGSDTVRVASGIGYDEKNNYKVTGVSDGQYKFDQKIIPGVYIIRYIYGDGRTYDVTANVKKYNGQDYKSTIDEHYNSSWYYKSPSDNLETEYEEKSKARDNEARRLEVMAYSTQIDQTMAVLLEVSNREFNELTAAEIKIISNYYDNNKTDIHEKVTGKSVATTDEAKYELVQEYVLQRTWMCAETSRIYIRDSKQIEESSTDTSITYSSNSNSNSTKFEVMNFGLAKRPETKIEIEKHITSLKITPDGTGVQPVVQAYKDIDSVMNADGPINPDGITTGLSTMKSTRTNRGYWKVETDVEELMQGGILEVDYTYVIKNISDEDYLSKGLIDAYENENNYAEFLDGAKGNVLSNIKKGFYSYSNNNNIGTYLGKYYYTGTKGSNDAAVLTTVQEIEQSINDLGLRKGTTDFAEISRTVGNTSIDRSFIDKEGLYLVNGLKVETVVKNAKQSENLAKDGVDNTLVLGLEKKLAVSDSGEIGFTCPSYLTEIVKFSNAAGRRNMNAIPGNLKYVHSEDTNINLENRYVQLGANDKINVTQEDTGIKLTEMDEFWGESIIITKPTGDDKQTPIQIAIIIISSIAMLGVGIILIKKLVLKK